jgi:hypothetical protein
MTTEELKKYMETHKRVGPHIPKILNAKPLNLPKVNLPLDPYVLGAWLGDGSMMVSDVVMLNSKLKSLKDAFIISKKTYKHIKQNLAFSLIYNTITIPIAAAGFIIPLFAALSMSLSSLVVVLNSLRIKLK